MTIWKLCEYDDILPWSLGFLVYDCYDERAAWRSKYGPLIGWAKRGVGEFAFWAWIALTDTTVTSFLVYNSIHRPVTGPFLKSKICFFKELPELLV